MARNVVRLAALAFVVLSRAPAVSAAPPGAPAALHGVLDGVVVPMDPYFQWKPSEARAGILGVMEGVTREFENIAIEVGGDRTVFGAAQRLGYEAYRIRHEVEPGELQTTEVKGDLATVRMKLKDVVYLCAAKQLGRTPLWVRASCEKKWEAALAKLLTGTVQRAKPAADDVDAWIPAEVKTAWTRKTEGDLLVVEDGAVGDPGRAAILEAVRGAGALVKQGLGGGWATPFPPVVRITGSRDLFSHLAGRRDLGDVDAVHLPAVGELLVCPRKRDEPDAATIAPAAASHALHHLLGAAGAEPLETGFSRRAAAAAEGADPGALLPRDQARAIERVKAKEAHTWMRMLKAPSVVRVFASPDPERAIDAELSAIWLSLSGGPLSKASLAAWVGAFKKTGHADAASEAGYGAVDAAKADAEFWAWWGPRADPPKKPKPGEKPGPKKPNPGK
jgi:hypothetical protein